MFQKIIYKIIMCNVIQITITFFYPKVMEKFNSKLKFAFQKNYI